MPLAIRRADAMPVTPRAILGLAEGFQVPKIS